MKNRCAGLAVVVLSLVAFGIGNAQIAFYGVVDPNTHTVIVDSAIVFISPTVTTYPTPGWQATGATYDTFPFPTLTRWPDSVELIGSIDVMPNVSMFPSPVPNVFYRFNFGSPVAPRALFYSGDVNIEEPGSAGPLRRLDVSPSVVTGQMTVRLQPAGPGRPVVEIHDAVGNVVRALGCTAGANGIATATWNREDGLGRLVPEGVYFCRYAASGVVAVRKVLVTN